MVAKCSKMYIHTNLSGAPRHWKKFNPLWMERLEKLIGRTIVWASTIYFLLWNLRLLCRYFLHLLFHSTHSTFYLRRGWQGATIVVRPYNLYCWLKHCALSRVKSHPARRWKKDKFRSHGNLNQDSPRWRPGKQTCWLRGKAPPTASNMVPVSASVLNDRLISVPTVSSIPLSST